MIEGEIKIGETVLSRRDGLGVYDTDSFQVEALKESFVLLMEVAMI